MGDGHGEKLTRTMEAAIAALLTCRTISEAAAKANISERTLRTWLKQSEFLAEYRAARRQVVEHAIAQLQRSADAAAKTLARNLKCGAPGAEIRAAVAILDQSLKAVQLVDLEERLAALEYLSRRERECRQ